MKFGSIKVNQRKVAYMKTYKTVINPLSANPTNWSKTLKQFIDR